MNTLKRSTDRKTANLATPNGKQAKIKNAFGLPSGREFSCPGATSVCEGVCYAGKLEKLFKGMRESMLHNWELVTNASAVELVAMLNVMVDEFVADCDRWGADKLFRIHHDGDFYSAEYAMAWRAVMLQHPEVTFWAYTRSFDIVPILAGIDNFTLYLSVDTANANAALKVYRANPWAKLAMLDTTFDNAKATMSDVFDAKAVRCPEVNKAIPLITANGGACKTCGLCVTGRNNVLFSSSKK